MGHATSFPVSPPAEDPISWEVTKPKSSCPCVEHGCRRHPGDHLDGIRREPAASAEDAHQLGAVSNAIAWEHPTSSLRVTLPPADLAAPGFQSPALQPHQTAAGPGTITALHGFFHSWLSKHPAPAPAAAFASAPPELPPPVPAPPGLTGGGWVERPFFIVTADTEKKKR